MERDTDGALQCHPYPGEFSDKSKPFHRSYFMGLRRKEGSNPQESEQFDIRRTVDDFKRDVYQYSFLSHSMRIHVLYVKRKDIPNFVFPGGGKPAPSSRSSVESCKLLRSNSPQADMVVSRKRRRQYELGTSISLTESTNTAIFCSDATSVEELEPLKPSITRSTRAPSTIVPAQKPVLRLTSPL